MEFQVGIKLCLKVSPWKGSSVIGKWNVKPQSFWNLSRFRKCHADEPLVVLLDVHFVEEPEEIVGREVKRLKGSRIPLVKVRWNSKRGSDVHGNARSIPGNTTPLLKDRNRHQVPS
ncbi:hypothetical protein Tco_0799658 [Tanacetum coccineum]|uniref:Reverse transcriptase domain-containing protein n=1 Tax=Tanacetum coccineum TaxID=301880 RepID=A0ABQ4ZRY0_9ASTR